MSEDDIAAQRNTSAFCELMRFEVERARDWFRRGLPLIKKVDRELAIDIELFSRGGQEILNAIEAQGCNVLGRRPAISKSRKLALVCACGVGQRCTVGKNDMSAAVQQAPAPSSPRNRSWRWLTRCAAALPAPRPRISTTPFWCCRKAEAPGAVCGVCVHAPLRRHCR